MVEETRVDVTIGEADNQPDQTARKDQPVWMVESTVITSDTQVSLLLLLSLALRVTE